MALPANMKTNPSPLRIAIIAGESSGDLLGGKLMKALKAHYPATIEFLGIGGDRMKEEGLSSLFPMSELSLIGFAEIIPHIPHLLKRITQTTAAILAFKPDAVITIDAPEFCFRVAKKLQGKGIKLIHYVAPSVWAYRPHRAASIAKLYQHLLTLLPFEPAYFEPHGLACSYIGHPIIEENASGGDAKRFREVHHIGEGDIITMMPGSRCSEIKRLWPIFAEAVTMLATKYPAITIVIPTVSHLVEDIKKRAASLPVKAIVIMGNEEKRNALAASTVALVKSGTGTLEVAIAGVPMIMGYNVKPLSAWILRRMIKIRYVNLVNLILDKEAIPEYLQERCTAPLLAEALDALLSSEEQRELQKWESIRAMQQLGYGLPESPSQKAAIAVLKVIGAHTTTVPTDIKSPSPIRVPS